MFHADWEGVHIILWIRVYAELLLSSVTSYQNNTRIIMSKGEQSLCKARIVR